MATICARLIRWCSRAGSTWAAGLVRSPCRRAGRRGDSLRATEALGPRHRRPRGGRLEARRGRERHGSSSLWKAAMAPGWRGGRRSTGATLPGPAFAQFIRMRRGVGRAGGPSAGRRRSRTREHRAPGGGPRRLAAREAGPGRGARRPPRRRRDRAGRPARWWRRSADRRAALALRAGWARAA